MANSKLLIAAIAIVSIIGLASAAGFLYGQNQTLKSQVSISATPTPQAQASVSPPVQASSTPAPTPAPKSAEKPTVVFEGAVNSSPDKSQIQARIIDPIIDYYAEHPDEGSVVSITIAENPYPSKTTDPYTYKIVLKNGAYSSALISKSGGQISWFGPSCMVCTFSAAYKAKYPEVVKNY